jgi:hypothetical protein
MNTIIVPKLPSKYLSNKEISDTFNNMLTMITKYLELIKIYENEIFVEETKDKIINKYSPLYKYYYKDDKDDKDIEKMCDSIYYKKIIKELQLRIHPDKNNNSDISTNVFQIVKTYIDLNDKNAIDYFYANICSDDIFSIILDYKALHSSYNNIIKEPWYNYMCDPFYKSLFIKKIEINK